MTEDDVVHGLIWRGEVIEPGFPINVVDGRRLGAWWGEQYRGARPRRADLTALVFHHQGGEGRGTAFFRNTSLRRSSMGRTNVYGAHFHIEQDGTIWQMADMATVLSHAGLANEWSVGCEIASVGRGAASKRWPRERYAHSMHGRIVEDFRRFYPEQIEAAFLLACAFVDVAGVPYRLPTRKGEPVFEALPEKALRRWRGLLGHFHVTPKKIDPSPHLIRELWDRLAKLQVEAEEK